MPAPAASRPSAREAPPMRCTVGSSQVGMRKPSRLAIRTEAVAMISGLRNSSRRKWVLPCRAMGQTAPMLKVGTQKPISTEIISSPCGPAMRSARASAMKELKRKPTWALAACSRRSMWRPSRGQ